MIFRTASVKEVALVLDWAHNEGWNPGIDDAHAFWTADDGGFFLAEVEGEIVAVISVVNHDDAHAFLGLYLCKPEFRGRGIGFALWATALKHAGMRTVGLDGVAEQQSNYAKSGFVKTGSTMRFEGGLPAGISAGQRPYTSNDLIAVATLDRKAIGYMRPRFLSGWVQKTKTRNTFVSERNGRITGFATARLCRNGCKIGPVIAPDAGTALALMRAAAKFLDAKQVVVDLPDSQAAFREVLLSQGFTSTFETARMYRGTPPVPAAPKTLFGVASLELG